ncbi:antibiotic biosynthesis monooxygenase [Micromonospora sp. WMMD882]|uniref:antibiotic biosynthesis monooxygenase family protein n=1 Tax=Micromonospora sp. WMMD882 TaxID=3015151 RepID=UPI00248BA3F4|nr:antibiotic biosynthesis monooxygenase [Micromonospora sp. WMMD882]WBB81552.1 antibiotic biosynthesis monooxygenase [Micromonospora sp. WMMD882]
MAVVKINAIDVPPGAGEELERRFAARAGAVENSPGFLGFELLRPVAGETRYFVYTRWESEEAYQAWAAGPAKAAHAGGGGGEGGGEQRRPVASGANLLEFEVVQEVTGPR